MGGGAGRGVGDRVFTCSVFLPTSFYSGTCPLCAEVAINRLYAGVKRGTSIIRQRWQLIAKTNKKMTAGMHLLSYFFFFFFPPSTSDARTHVCAVFLVVGWSCCLDFPYCSACMCVSCRLLFHVPDTQRMYASTYSSSFQGMGLLLSCPLASTMFLWFLVPAWFYVKAYQGIAHPGTWYTRIPPCSCSPARHWLIRTYAM